MKHLAMPLVALVLLPLAAAPAAAQTTLALTGGLNIASADVTDAAAVVPEAVSVTRMSFGLATDFSLSGTFGIQLGGRYAQKGVGLEIDEEGVNIESSVELDYLEFTALARLRFPLAGERVSIHLLTGPAVAAETGCGLRATADSGDSVFELEEECDEVNLERSAVDIGWVVGSGLNIGITDNLSASPGVLYTHGLVDVDTATQASLKNRALTLQIGLAYTVR